MANTYSQLYVQMVFAVKNRKSLILSENKDKVEKQIWGIASNIKCNPISIYCNPDHTHFLVSIKPVVCIADAIRDIKSFSSRYINENCLLRGRFEWQTGYGVFTYGQSQIDQVKKYIENQSEHHKKRCFRDEYIALLKAFRIEYNETYLFDWID
ncbi:MAG: IS200/IS605 family transposase [Bacteroidetes bacterium]|nr:IS200/IS605 family transposase [Bacteroidota bacterium]MCL2303053.1 IS200/IS605 family transposase [Lentimicrobiaceae bacterium]